MTIWRNPLKDTRQDMDDRTLEEESPLTPEEARKELGWDLLPFNGTVPEVDE